MFSIRTACQEGKGLARKRQGAGRLERSRSSKGLLPLLLHSPSLRLSFTAACSVLAQQQDVKDRWVQRRESSSTAPSAGREVHQRGHGDDPMVGE